MAVSIVEYWDGDSWEQANTNASVSATIRVDIVDKLGNPRVANITLMNPSAEPFGSGSDRYGPLTGVFSDFTPVRIIESNSKVVLFAGKVYSSNQEYDKAFGQVIKVYARDNLAELADIPTDDKTKFISSDSTVNTRSEMIQKIIRDSASDPHSSSLMISTANILTNDTQKFETSGKTLSTGTKFDVSSMGKQGLKVIAEIANNDAHETSSPVKDFGYDYYVDTQFEYPGGSDNPAADFNYFKRGTRTTFESTASNFKGLTIEYPVVAFTKTGIKVPMLPDYDFNKPSSDMYTGAIVVLRSDIKDADGATFDHNTALEFEVLEGTPSAAFIHADPTISTSAWEGKKFARVGDVSTPALKFADYLWKLGVNTDTTANLNGAINDSVTTLTIEETGTAGDAAFKTGQIIMITTGGNSENMYVTAVNSNTEIEVIRGWGSTHSDYSVAVAHDDDDTIYRHPIVGRLQYQSTNSGAGYILISFERDTVSDVSINTQKKEFESIATGSSEITLTNGNQHFDFTPSTGRPKVNYGINRPLRITGNDIKNVDAARERIASSLSRVKLTRTECVVSTLPPPFTYLATGVASITSGTVVVLDDNAYLYGARIGMTIAKVNSAGVVTAYGYITTISGATVTTARGLNTGSWSGYDGDIRVYIPVRAGHYIRVNNILVNFEGYMFVQEITYTEQAGAQLTMYKGTGVNTAGTNSIGIGTTYSIVTAIEGEAQKYPRITNVPMGGLGWTFRPTSTTDTASFSPTDRITIAWTGGEFIIGGMKRYKIVAGNSGGLVTTEDSNTTFPYLHKIVFDPDQTPDSNGAFTFEVFTEQAGVTSGVTTFYPDMDYIILGHCRAAKTSTGLATLIFDGTGTGMFGGKSGTGEDAFSAALFKKSLQPYTTNMNLFVGNSSAANKQRYIHATAGVAGTSTSGTISFADNTTIALEYNNSLDLGTVDNTVYYIYYKLVNSGNTETSDFTDVDAAEIERTTTYSDATSDSRGLLAICSTGDVSELDEIAIQAFHGKGQNITADVIAANAITAEAIKTGSLNSHTITLTGSDGLIKTSPTVNDGSGTDQNGLIISSAGGIVGYAADGTVKLNIAAGTGLITATDVTLTGAITATSGSFLNSTGSTGNNKSVTIDSGFIILNNDTNTVGSGIRFDGQDTGDTTVLQRGYIYYDSSQDRLEIQTTNDTYLLFNGILPVQSATPLVLSVDSDQPTGSYGMFRYATDGGGGSSSVLAFTSDQQTSSPATDTDRSAFWVMQSEANRLIFEPIVDYAGSNNNAWIGYHNPLVGINSWWHSGGAGTEALPTFTFYTDLDTGMYTSASNVLSFSTGAEDRVRIASSGLYPADDDTYDLGVSGTRRWDDIYATNTTVSTSDRREKTNITPTLLGLDFINALNPVSYKWKKKPERPTYYGLIAQEVIETLKEHGIESRDGFGGITGTEDSSYGARYEEFIAILIKAVQELSEKIKKLEEER